MKILDITTPLTLPPSKTPRSPGQHVSGIIRPLAAEVGFLDKKWCEDLSLVDTREITDPTTILRIRIGLAWEQHLIPTLEGVVDHPGELKLEGVYMSPDGESVDRVFSGSRGIELIIHEVKATYKSSRRDVREQWMWLTQIKAYCKAAGTRFARLYILYICGDYKAPISPQHHIYEIEFSQEELETSWATLVDYLQMRLQNDGVLNTSEEI